MIVNIFTMLYSCIIYRNSSPKAAAWCLFLFVRRYSALLRVRFASKAPAASPRYLITFLEKFSLIFHLRKNSSKFHIFLLTNLSSCVII